MSRHRGEARLPARLPAVLISGVLLSLIFLFSILALTREPTALPARTVTVPVPGPTVTVSYLIIRTATPGVNGF